MGKRLFSETIPPAHPIVEIGITEPNPTFQLFPNPTLDLFPCIPTPQPLVETPIIQDNHALQLFPIQTPVLEPVQTHVPELEAVQSPVPPSQPPAQTHVQHPIPVPKPTLFQFASLYPQSTTPPQQPMPPQPSHSPPSPSLPHIHPHERARPDQQSETTETIDIPFKWATNRRARIHSFHYLTHNEIFDIKGDVECKKCERKFEMSFDVREKFPEVSDYIMTNSPAMNERAENVWMNPTLPDCEHCNKKNCVKPIIAEEKEKINWLFLFLGQMLGCCSLEQLKYWCKYNDKHRTGAKDRVLYLTYLTLCNQLHSNRTLNIS